MSIASGDLRAPVPAEKSAESQARLDLFDADIDLEGASSDHAGTVGHHEGRARRVAGTLATVDQLLPGGGDNEAAHAQANGNPPTELLAVGEHFRE
ncbi:hypothetical protein ColTof4_14085 [Colletotrichum tofieldiae]|nr:hypothetical protein ColTof3_02999 [Colletotrichum tofieldiae]GKT81662.1 hypothetical protein ColTof4_14085 [Colletotrichum tofieldiae]GKT82679.1 hypothetical protein Ct61P_00529 [Colletotrichum tofieldiae]